MELSHFTTVQKKNPLMHFVSLDKAWQVESHRAAVALRRVRLPLSPVSLPHTPLPLREAPVLLFLF